MNEIFEQARNLGKALLECEEAQKLYEARHRFDNDPAAIQLISEYDALKDKWQAIMEDKDSDKKELTTLGEEIRKKEEEIRASEVSMELMKAESQYGAFVNSVFNLISATIQGQDEAGCDPSCCASCGGGCH